MLTEAGTVAGPTDGRFSYRDTDADPFMTPCPSWCSTPDAHRIAFDEDDRSHLGQVHTVGLRHLTAAQDPGDGVTLAHAELYLEHHALRRDPVVVAYLDRGGRDTASLRLTIDEAAEIARRLQQLVDQALGDDA